MPINIQTESLRTNTKHKIDTKVFEKNMTQVDLHGYMYAGKCQDRPCKYVARLSKMEPADCLNPQSCHVICATPGWCIHDNDEGDKGLLKTRYKGTQCECPSGIIMQVRRCLDEHADSSGKLT